MNASILPRLLLIALLSATISLAGCEKKPSSDEDASTDTQVDTSPDTGIDTVEEDLPADPGQDDSQDAADADADDASVTDGEQDTTGDAATDVPAEDSPPLDPCAGSVAGTVESATVGDLHGLIADGAVLTVVDVREPVETSFGAIEGAVLMPWASGVLTASHGALPASDALFVICATGSRSAAAAAFLASNGHGCVHDVTGGMSAWSAAGYPTVAP